LTKLDYTASTYERTSYGSSALLAVSGIDEERCSIGTSIQIGLLAAATRRSIGRSRPVAAADCGHGLMGNMDELDGVTDKLVVDLSVLTAGEENCLNLRGPLSCCTAAHTETDRRHCRLYYRLELLTHK